MAKPGVYALPPGVDFASELLAGLKARVGTDDPFALARCRIVVNTERSARRLRALMEQAPVGLPPRITVLPALAAEAPGLPAPRSSLARRLRLAQLVRGLLAADPTAGARTAAYPLADTLAALLGEMQIEGVSVEELRDLDVSDAAGHWARALGFLNVIGTVLAESEDGVDSEARLALGLARIAAQWLADPPEGPVLVAGSTGSRGATARFMVAVAALPQGMVVLPGLDPDLPRDVWEVLAAPDAPVDHPQSALGRFCTRAGVRPWEVPCWTTAQPASKARGEAVSLALRPAPVTDQWLRDGPRLAEGLDAAFAGVSWLTAEDPAEEALAIAVALRRALEEGQRAALITPDRTLARRVTAALDRWQVRQDDSAGRPLAQTPPGVLLRQTAALFAAHPDPVALIALLKHPLVGGQGSGRAQHLTQVAALQTLLRRRGGPAVGAGALRGWADEVDDPAFSDWLSWLAGQLPKPAESDLSLPLLVARHRDLTEALVAGPAGSAAPLWAAAAGEAAATLWAELEQNAADGGAMPAVEYPLLLRTILGRVEVPDDAYVPHPNLAIWGTLEARVQTADLVVLGGLSEGRWPQLPAPDPWLSRDMRADLGLPLPEGQIGLSAHDFQQAVAARRVILSCPRREGEAPAVPSRWLLRIENLLGGLGEVGSTALHDMRARGDDILALTRRLHAPAATLPRAPRPAPIPPAEAVPAQLSVTRIETLAKDPYAIYAREVLGLRALDPLRRIPDYREMGTRVHEILERFVRETQEDWPEDPEAVFRTHALERLAHTVPWPSTRAFWAERLSTMARWFVESEPDRRAFAPPALLEETGRVAVEGLPRPFRLVAKADRIDAGPSGPVAIYDYKNSAPAPKTLASFYPQLRLEAAMVARGGFDALGAREVGRLAVIQTKPPAHQMEIADSADEIEAHWLRFQTLVAAFQSGVPFAAGPPADRFGFASDYEHLARVGEWDAADPPEPERVG